MFDRHVKHVSHGPSRIDVHEHKAPTDASIDLLRQMEEKVMRNTVAVHYVTGDNKLEAVSIVYAPDPAAFRYEWIVAFKLNGKIYTDVAEISAIEVAQLRRDPRRIAERITSEFVRTLTALILPGVGVAEFRPDLLEHNR